jgi:hypothetical protein
MKLLITQFPPASCHLISLKSKYSPQHHVLTHLQSMFTEIYLYEIRVRANVKLYCVSASRRYIEAVFHATSTADGDECSVALLGHFLNRQPRTMRTLQMCNRTTRHEQTRMYISLL